MDAFAIMRAVRSDDAQFLGFTEPQMRACARIWFQIDQKWERTVLTRKVWVSAIVFIGLGLHNVGQLAAETYPTRPIKLVTPNSPGSPPDVIARIVAQRLATTIGPVI